MTTTTRSPNYPRMDLSQAIERIKVIYAKEQTHAASSKVIAEDLGYSGINGASMAIISAMKKYGLLVSEGDSLKLSEDAIAILELPENDAERSEAIRRCAFAPNLFEELHQTYGDTLPSEANLRHVLVKKKFNPKTADEVIRIYRDTLSFVASQKAEYNTSMTVKTPTEIVETAPAGKLSPDVLRALQYQFRNATPTVPDETDEDLQELRFRISGDSEAKVSFRGEVTQEAIEKLIKLLDLSKDTFPRISLLPKVDNLLPNVENEGE